MARLTSNIGSLYALQIANYVLPLITLPYLVRVLGIQDYGLLAFTYSLIQYFVIITDYGFNLSATRQVAMYKLDEYKLSQVVSAVFFIKTGFMILSALVLSAIVYFVDEYRTLWVLYVVGFSLVIGNVLFPVWLYQGMEKMAVITILNVSAKAISAVAIFIFVQEKADLPIAVFLQSAGGLFAGLGSIYVMHQFFPSVRICIPDVSFIKNTLNEGWHIFVSQLSANLVSNSNVLILGIFHGSHSVGQYAIAEKIIKAAINLQMPVCNAVFPRVGVLFRDSPASARAFLRRIIKYFLPVAATVSLCMLFGADKIILLIAGTSDPEAALLIQIMSLLPITVFLDNIFGTQILLNLGYKRQFMNAILYSGIIAIVLSLILVPRFSAMASASIYLGSEIILLLIMIWQVRRLGLWRDGKDVS